MSGPATADDLLDLIRRSRLFDPARLTDVARDHPAGSPQELAAALVRDRLLTRFQADQLLRGKYRGFSLGKYRILDRIGSGGMGRVYLAEHTVLGRRVAIKVLPPALAADDTAKVRFRREARAAAALDHPNIVRVFDLDHDHGLDLLVMEYVDGKTLSSVVRKGGAVSVGRGVNYLWQAALGLGHAHSAGLVHRDIKPLNLLLDRGGTVKILDMGLARFADGRDEALTRAGDGILGTADYLAPEQAIDSAAADFRSDVYSLGATAYFLFAGHPPFPEGTATEKLIAHQMRQPRPLPEIRPDLPTWLEAIVRKMLAKSPDDRFADANAVAAALAPFARGETAAPPKPRPIAVRAPETARPPVPETPPPSAKTWPATAAAPGANLAGRNLRSRVGTAAIGMSAALAGLAWGLGLFEAAEPTPDDAAKIVVRAGGAYSTVRAALEAVSAGGTVWLGDAELRESLAWDGRHRADVTITAESPVTWRPPPDHPPDLPLVAVEAADGLRLHNIRFDGEHRVGELVRLTGGRGAIVGCEFDAAAIGVRVGGGGTWTVERNRFGVDRSIAAKPPGTAVRMIDNEFRGPGRIAEVEGSEPPQPPERVKAIGGGTGVWHARRTFDLGERPKREGQFDGLAETALDVWLNGEPIAAWRGGDRVEVVPVGRHLRPGQNVLAARVRGTWLRLRLTLPAGELSADANWRTSTEAEPGWLAPSFEPTAWKPATVITAPPSSVMWEREAAALRQRFPFFAGSHGNRREGNGPPCPFLPIEPRPNAAVAARP